MIRVAHVISGLETGGAELFLERLVGLLGGREFEHRVVSMLTVGPVGERLRQRGVRVDALRGEKGRGTAFGLLELSRLLREAHPDLVQGWLYHGNLGAWVALRLSRIRCPLVWAVRHSLDRWGDEGWRLRSEIRFGGCLAGAPEHIIFNSRRSARQHERLGYSRAKASFIPNGFDVKKFVPRKEARTSTRAGLAIGADEVVIGNVGRFHPLKDHTNLLRAIRIVYAEMPDVRLVLAGRDVTRENSTLMKTISELRLEHCVVLLGEGEDVATLVNGFDIYVSASSSEAFPNAVGEAMSSGVPCVVTDAGDSAELVGNTGTVVPVQSPERLAAAVLQLIRDGSARRRELGAAARERIRANYSMERVVQQYADLYRSVYERETSCRS